jgi:putative ABC transport system permease protein
MFDFKLAFANLTSTTLRTILAMLGILVGTASVVAMVSSGQMATQQALAQFKSLGTDMMSISLYSEGNSGSSSSDTPTFDLTKALAIENASPAIKTVAPYTLLYAPASYQGNSINSSIIGATYALSEVVRIKMKLGRFISDLDHYEPYCVIGNAIYKNIEPYAGNPIGTQIKLGDMLFTIIGVADNWPENGFFNQDLNNSIIIPIRASNLLSKYANIENVVLQLFPNSDIPAVQEDLTRYIKGVAPDKKLFFRSAKELVKSMGAQHDIFTMLLGFIGSVSLLVGGIGVMNIMLVSVMERRREIGIRLALGARRKEIQWMFLSEAILLSLSGGLLGILTGILCSFIIAEFAHWHFEVFFWPPFIGFSVSVLIGIFFGIYPAHKASQLDPIQTLRTE